MSGDPDSNTKQSLLVAALFDELTSELKLAEVVRVLSDLKGKDILEIDLRGKSLICDYMVITSGKSSRQVNAIANKLADHIKQKLHYSARIEGKNSDDWIIVDAGDVVIHIFRPEVREFYQLEKLWQTTLVGEKRA